MREFISLLILASFLFAEGSSENADGDHFHSLLTKEELLHYFEVSEPYLVRAEHYELVTVLGVSTSTCVLRTVGHNGYGIQESPLSKRDGGSADHDHRVSLSAFGRSYSLALTRNREILAEGAEVIMMEHDGREQSVLLASKRRPFLYIGHVSYVYIFRPIHVGRGEDSCHYQVSEYGRYVGGFSNCGEERRDYSGFFKDGKHLYEVMKLRPRLKELVRNRGGATSNDEEGGNVHLVRYTSGRELPANATGTTTKERLRRLRALEDKIRINAGQKLDLLGQIEEKLEQKLKEEEEEQQRQQEEYQEREQEQEELHDYIPRPRQNDR